MIREAKCAGTCMAPGRCYQRSGMLPNKAGSPLLLPLHSAPSSSPTQDADPNLAARLGCCFPCGTGRAEVGDFRFFYKYSAWAPGQ
eukprot:3744025-Rhodomonas_salina.1